MRRSSIMVLTALASLSFYLTLTFAANTGIIKGRVTAKETGEPVIGASVFLVGTQTGAQTDVDGYYEILRISPGRYTMRISHLEFQTVDITDVRVAADSLTEVDYQMVPKVTERSDQAITVVGKKDVLDRFQVSGTTSINQETIKHRAVCNLDRILEQIPDVATNRKGEVFVRGGRAGEVSYIVDGAPVSDPLGGIGSCGATLQKSGQFPPAHGGTAIVNGAPFDAMFFEHAGVNPFVDTEDDHFSTFAIDVDDASFNITRAYLERGSLPPKEAVRVEEFVNHFDYDYDPPDCDAFRVIMEGAPSRFGPRGAMLLSIGIKGKVVEEYERKPANLVFVIDISGSMSREDRLGLVKKSLMMLTDRLTAQDRVGIVVYGSDARVLMHPVSGDRRRYIRRIIESIASCGSTYAEKGIRLGYEMAGRMFERGHINRVILCSDGVANVGVTSPDEILKQIKRYADKGITLTAVGFGMGNFNDVLMEKLGDKGNGQYAYVDDIKEAKRLFVDNMTGMLENIARDVKIQVDFNPGVVRSYRLLGYENRDVADNKFRDDKEDGGEIGAGHAVTALYEIKLEHLPKSETVATVFIRYKDPDSGEVTEINIPFQMDAFTPSFGATSDDFRLAAAAAQFAEILRGSYWARGETLDPVLGVVRGLTDRSDNPEIDEIETLITLAVQHQDQLARK